MEDHAGRIFSHESTATATREKMLKKNGDVAEGQPCSAENRVSTFRDRPWTICLRDDHNHQQACQGVLCYFGNHSQVSRAHCVATRVAMTKNAVRMTRLAEAGNGGRFRKFSDFENFALETSMKCTGGSELAGQPTNQRSSHERGLPRQLRNPDPS